MGFGFREKSKEKENTSRPRKKSDHVKSLSPTGRPGSPLGSGIPPAIRFDDRPSDRPTSSHGLFSLGKSKGLKKKRSLASLLAAASEATRSDTLQPPSRPVRALSSDGSSHSHLVMPTIASLSATKEKVSTAQDLRKEEYRKLQLQAPTPQSSVSTKKMIWAKRHNMKVHTQQAVYMQAYDPILLENDRYLDILLRRLNPLDNPTFRDCGWKVPLLVLDVGCGTGLWLLEASEYWPQSSMTGLDMVDILLPEVQSSEKIHLTRGNFLQPWPFHNKSFDLVRMCNLSLCIPYDKWEAVLAEAHRVLTIDGRLELIDDQIFFPYAPQPSTRSTSLSVYPPKPPVLTRGTSFFDMGDSEQSEEDDTDAESVKTESTLINDGDTSSSSHFRRSSGAPPSSPSASLGDPNTPTSATSTNPPDTAWQSEWSIDAAASRDMETVFENMLNRKFGIHSRPSEFIVDLLQHVFGNGEKMKSFHLKLAPKDAYLDFECITGPYGAESGEKEETGMSSESKKVGHMINEMAKRFNADVDKDREEKKRLKKLNKALTPTAEAPDTRIPEGLSAKAAGRLGIREEIPKNVLRVPENVSAKAALRLGISMASERESKGRKNGKSLCSPSPSPSPPSEAESEPSATPSPNPSPPAASAAPSAQDGSIGSVNESRLSAKAAHRLGIPYSALPEAAASAKTRRPISSSSTLVSTSTGPTQSPGLIVWPSKFIPLSPTELEMHACKNVHTLVGCKPALTEYIATFVNQDGSRVETDEGVDQALWDYECFRRRRFDWPCDIPEWDTDPDTDALDSAISVSTLKSGDTPKSATFKRNSMAITNVPWASPPDIAKTPQPHSTKNSDLLHVRTLRVFEAVKTGDYTLTTLPFPRSPPPSPPR
ncbi:hypothetical protein DXG03_001528 [Asterophora parasitica]|uniref:Methyltransferase domain-containing protein n=1 Tax=Asterophora parasitica TaxID=117018 RepID=A0A9P7KAA2_9AGAR|nr:hypothetical protein DXG03_001528 [Asterophora parasitica]